MEINKLFNSKIFSIKYFCNADNTLRYLKNISKGFLGDSLSPDNANLYTYYEALKIKKDLDTYKNNIYKESVIFKNHGKVSCSNCIHKCNLEYNKKCFNKDNNKSFIVNEHIDYCNARSNTINLLNGCNAYQVFDSMNNIYCDYYESK